jgi:hypothetical protein
MARKGRAKIRRDTIRRDKNRDQTILVTIPLVRIQTTLQRATARLRSVRTSRRNKLT